MPRGAAAVTGCDGRAGRPVGRYGLATGTPAPGTSVQWCDGTRRVDDVPGVTSDDMVGSCCLPSGRAAVEPMRPENRGGGNEVPDPGRPSDAEDRHRVTEALTTGAAAGGVRQAPELLCRACVDLLPVSGASIPISGSSTVRALWGAGDETAARLAEAQYTLGDGPCRQALGPAAPVLAPDLTGGPDARRWPVFARRAVELGVRAVFSLPLGTLDLHRDTAGPLSSRDLRTVHQAVGMVMVQLGTGPEQALDRLRAHALSRGRTVTEVAREVVARTLRLRPADDDRPKGRGRSGDEGTGERS
ncbi:GAF and ANTAR domain-containing protein [Streptomyces sp. NPDC006285]|uniref:GAF and ANTAR domain-containing protein n=1 Tax=Streptomyces sp. NPDC006285 TaxID=3364742 RepID=UPI0036B87F65